MKKPSPVVLLLGALVALLLMNAAQGSANSVNLASLASGSLIDQLSYAATSWLLARAVPFSLLGMAFGAVLCIPHPTRAWGMSFLGGGVLCLVLALIAIPIVHHSLVPGVQTGVTNVTAAGPRR